ncbi:MAG: extracellular solute-binding protein [Planctomycetota bacterium]
MRPVMRLASLLLVLVTLTLVSCSDGGSPGDRETVVLYSSVDRWLMEQEILPAAEAATGLEIRYLGDNEANKTTGLVQRLLSEKDSPRADVWWSSEPFGTVRLAQESVLTPSTPDTIPADWPARLVGTDNLWYGFGQRARVIAYHPERVPESDLPRSMPEFVEVGSRYRIGIARPEFGTTRGHMAALLASWGEETFREWLAALEAAGVKIYDGNATVVRAIATGEIDLGLTDTDDVYAAQRNGDPVAMTFESWSLLFPNTAGLVAGGPNPDAGAKLLAWILSPECERLLAASDSRNIPVHASLEPPLPELAGLEAMEIDFAAVAANVERAMQLVGEVLGP